MPTVSQGPCEAQVVCQPLRSHHLAKRQARSVWNLDGVPGLCLQTADVPCRAGLAFLQMFGQDITRFGTYLF